MHIKFSYNCIHCICNIVTVCQVHFSWVQFYPDTDFHTVGASFGEMLLALGENQKLIQNFIVRTTIQKIVVI